MLVLCLYYYALRSILAVAAADQSELAVTVDDARRRAGRGCRAPTSAWWRGRWR